MSTTTSGTSILPTGIKPSADAPSSMSRVRPAAARTGVKTRLVVAVIALAAVGVAGARYLLPKAILDGPEAFAAGKRDFAIVLHEKGELKAAKSIDVKCEIEGRSTIIWLIPEGSEVKEGDLLVKLASQEIEDKIRSESIKEANAKAAADAAVKEYEITVDEQASNVRKAELAVNNARIELNKYLLGDWGEQKTDAELEVKKAEEEIRRAKEKLADSEALMEKQFITKTELDDDRFAVFVAEIALQKAQLKKEILEKYTHPKDKGQKESDLAEAEKELDRAKKSHDAKIAQSLATKDARASEYEFTRQQLEKFQRQKSKTEIKAPAAGLVVFPTESSRWGNEGLIAEGKEVYERQTIINLPDTSQMQVVVRIHEGKADKVKPDQSVRVEVEGVPGVIHAGKVTKIAPLADSQNRWLNPDLKEYETQITLDGVQTTLKPGVTARAEIVVEEVKDVLAIPVQSVVSKQGKRFAFVGEGKEPHPIPVELGRSNDQFVEVLSGLAVGDRVRLAISEDDLKKLPESGGKDGGPSVAERRPGQGGNPGRPPEGRKPRQEGAAPAGGTRGSGSGEQGGGKSSRPSRP